MDERGKKRAREEVENEQNDDASQLDASGPTITRGDGPQPMAAPSALAAAPAPPFQNSGEEEEEEDEPIASNFKMSKQVRRGTECPYLDTISRQNLDFDFEKCCSVSLSHVNVYVCLVCGKYFQGRGPSTHAYTHSLEAGHHLFMKLDSGRTYCLPDMYEVEDRSLADIRFVLSPTYTEADVANLGRSVGWARALDGAEYMPGLVGLNNMRANDYANVVFQALMRITPLRDFFLRTENYATCTSPLVQRFGELVRKVCNPRAFKGHVSPHELMQAVMSTSNKRFVIDKRSDPAEFLAWIANALHMGLTGGKRKRSSIITQSLQGELEVTTLAGTGKAKDSATDVVDKVPFLMLALDLPPTPLYKDTLERVTIPQIPVFELLKKYDGRNTCDDVRAGQRILRVKRLPAYLVLHVRRFVRNQFFIEKNPTIVTFPVKGLDMSSVLPLPSCNGTAAPPKYDLVANIVHEGRAGEGTYHAHVHRAAEGTWYDVQDLTLSEVLPQVVALSEAYVQVYQLSEGS
jgi:U4/U6.U5 tri-snRNP-associated protein 2